MSTQRNLFVTILTHAAPSSNYRGESEENRTIIQKITRGNHEYPVISPESIRNALREILTARELPMNRRRLHDEDQLAVEFKAFPDPATYADDFLFGFMVADPKAVKEHKGQPSKRDSILRMNMAVSLTPYRHDATFHQSPLNAGASPWKNSATSALLHREVSYTEFQFPFALALRDCLVGKGPQWTKALLAAISELSNVAGGHARSYFEMAPRSIVVRLTPALVGGFNTYGFKADGSFPELARLKADDLPPNEFWIGGALARDLAASDRDRLASQGTRFFDNPQKLMAELGTAAFEGLS